MNPKILVGCPTSDHKKYCLKEYAEALKSLDYDNFDILIVDNSKDDEYFKEIKQQNLNVIKGVWMPKARDRIIHSRNMLKNYAIENKYDYFFSLEQDVIPKPNILKKLISHNKKIISGVVMNNLPVGNSIQLMPMAYVTHPHDPTGLWYLSNLELEKSQLMEIKACCLGCILIHKDILTQIDFRYTGGFDDMMFCKDVIDLGHTLYLDTTIKPKHLHSSWEGIEK